MEDAEKVTSDDEIDPTETSLEALLARRAAGESGEIEGEMLASEGHEPNERLPGKVAPKQQTEFVCKSCRLIKHRSQLADKRRGFCRDCAGP
ncbi:MAG: DUF4193 family protein [Actinomycetota bacterium]